ncbi:50S ribosomal protein L6 [Candidatus Azambacteria bacterium]|nr:50S ribosomal protein L6 [Candidatus Azambacteria bacterium]
MSRVGKQPIIIKEKVQVSVNGNTVAVKGPKGEISMEKMPFVNVDVKDGSIFISVPEGTEKGSAFWGLTRSLIANMIDGVVNGHEKNLEIEGVGYKVEAKGEKLVLALGFSHPVEFPAPKGIHFKVEKNKINISGIDKILVGQTAANIRKLKKPEPYKGKGIRYQGEVIRRKDGKKAAA